MFLAPRNWSKPLRSFILVSTNLDIFIEAYPSRFDIHNEAIPNVVFNLGLVLLFMVEHPIVALNPIHPKGDNIKKVLNLISLTNYLEVLSPKRVCFR